MSKHRRVIHDSDEDADENLDPQRSRSRPPATKPKQRKKSKKQADNGTICLLPIGLSLTYPLEKDAVDNELEKMRRKIKKLESDKRKLQKGNVTINCICKYH